MAAVAESPWRYQSGKDIRIRIPITEGRRGGFRYAKLIDSVQDRTRTMIDIKGKVLRPGAWISEEDLAGREPILLLEMTEVRGAPIDAIRKGWEPVSILWTWDREACVWREHFRSLGNSIDRVADVKGAAKRILDGRRGLRVVPGVEEMADRISQLVGLELDQMDVLMRRPVIAALYDRLESRIVREDVA